MSIDALPPLPSVANTEIPLAPPKPMDCSKMPIFPIEVPSPELKKTPEIAPKEDLALDDVATKKMLKDMEKELLKELYI